MIYLLLDANPVAVQVEDKFGVLPIVKLLLHNQNEDLTLEVLHLYPEAVNISFMPTNKATLLFSRVFVNEEKKTIICNTLIEMATSSELKQKFHEIKNYLSSPIHSAMRAKDYTSVIALISSATETARPR